MMFPQNIEEKVMECDVDSISAPRSAYISSWRQQNKSRSDCGDNVQDDGSRLFTVLIFFQAARLSSCWIFIPFFFAIKFDFLWVCSKSKIPSSSVFLLVVRWSREWRKLHHGIPVLVSVVFERRTCILWSTNLVLFLWRWRWRSSSHKSSLPSSHLLALYSKRYIPRNLPDSMIFLQAKHLRDKNKKDEALPTTFIKTIIKLSPFLNFDVFFFILHNDGSRRRWISYRIVHTWSHLHFWRTFRLGWPNEKVREPYSRRKAHQSHNIAPKTDRAICLCVEKAEILPALPPSVMFIYISHHYTLF